MGFKVEKAALDKLLLENIAHFENVKGQDIVRRAAEMPSGFMIPIPYFGDVEAYQSSTIRILTVGLNPSNREFQPKKSENDKLTGKKLVRRFSVGSVNSNQIDLNSQLSHYFKGNPYSWFNSFECVLKGCEASYGVNANAKHTALHIDVGSPIATSPTWSKLGVQNAKKLTQKDLATLGAEKKTKAGLTTQGKKFFIDMLQLFQPNIIIASVGRHHICEIDPIFDLKKQVYFKDRNANGELSKSNQRVVGGELAFASQEFYFANGSASTTPFGRFTNQQKQLAGEKILSEYHRLIRARN
jgi:hypothetical protein